MDRTNITFGSKIRKIGNSYYLLVKPEIREHLQLRDGKKVETQVEEGPYGPYLSMWNPDQQRSDEAPTEP